MNPFNAIMDWFNNQSDVSLKVDFMALAAGMEPQLRPIGNLLISNTDEALAQFNASIEADSNKPNPLSAALYWISFISLLLNGRDTEENWDISKQRMEQLAIIGKQDGYDVTFLNWDESKEERKSKWIAWADEWKALLSSSLSWDYVARWYFNQTIK